MTHRFVWLVVAGLFCGCSALSMRSQSPEDTADESAEKRQLVGDCATAFGLYPVKVEGIGLVTGLPGTGSDPAPSSERTQLLSEMQTIGVHNPNAVLAAPTTDLVLIRGYLRPGIQKGDHFDIEVRVPARSENTGLRGGWLMKNRLTELAVAGGYVRKGSLAAFSEGPILVDPSLAADGDKVLLGRGRVLNGGISQISRPLGLVIKPSFRTVSLAAQLGNAINRRFHTYKSGVKVGVAKPKTEQFIELTLHPRYKDNIERFVRVVRALPIRESAEEQLARMALLERNLLDPITSSAAAFKLEAIGKEAVPVLKKGLASPDVEVRFFAGEALAYLDEKSAAAPLGEIARDQPAFRAFAMAALGAMDDFDAYEALRGLLPSPSAETRYGAFRALWSMNENDVMVRDEKISSEFHYKVLEVEGPPMVHFTRNTRPEVVVFGRDVRLQAPIAVEAGPRIMVNSVGTDQVSISRFAVGEAPQKRVVSCSLDEVIRTIAQLGGTYPDVVQALQQAKATKALSARLEMEAVPRAGRTFEREAEAFASAEATATGDRAEELPEGLSDFEVETAEDETASAADPSGENEAETSQNPGYFRRWWSKMSGGN